QYMQPLAMYTARPRCSALVYGLSPAGALTSRTWMYGSTTSAAVARPSVTIAPAASLSSFSTGHPLRLRLRGEQRRARARRPEAQHHGQEVAHDDQVAGHHQRAAHAAPLEPGDRHRHRIHERPRGVEHRQALQPAADRQPDEVDADADRGQPEMQRDQARI